MKFFEEFKINGNPIPVPDAEVELSYQDLDAGSAGRDESGVMHRIPVRQNVASWDFSYGVLTDEEKLYLDNLFAGKATFTFTCNGKNYTCYRSGVTVSWVSARTGLWRGYGFSIIEC